MTGLDRRIAGGNGGLVGGDGGRHAGLTVNRATVGRGVPRHDQRDIRAAVVADTIRVGIHMVGVFFATCLADGTGFCALVLNIICLCP